MTEPLPAPLRVLLVEDNPDDAELIVRALREAGLEIDARVVATEAELLAALPAFVPEVVLSDWRLPGFSGEAAVAAAHAADPAVPVILISGTVGEDLVVKALHSGATDYVLKSRLEALVPAVRRALAEGAASREQIRLQAELEASQAAMRGSLDAMSDPFIICAAERDAAGTSVNFRVVFANRAAAAFMGRPPDTRIGAEILQQLLCLRGVRFFDAFREVIEGGHSWAEDSVEVSVTGPDGSTRRGLVDIQVARFGDGFFAVWRDVTERDRVRQEREQFAAALAVSEARLRTALDTMVDGVTIYRAIRDGHGRIVDFQIDYANSAIGTLGGPAGSLQMGRRVREMFPANWTNGLFEVYVRIVETGASVSLDDLHFVDPNAAGGPVDQRLDVRAARLEDGVVISIRDAGARHRAELEIRRLATAVEQSPDAVVITDTRGAIEYVNLAFETSTGYTREEVMGRNPRILKSGVQGPAFYAAMWAALTSGQPFVADITNRRKDGSIFQEEGVVSPILDDAGTITSYVAVKRDVTRERALEAEQVRIARERAHIAETLADLHVLPTPAATAAEIVLQVARLAGITTARIAYFTRGGLTIPLAFVRADGVPARLAHVPVGRGRLLRERAGAGPWVETWVGRSSHPYDRMFRELGVVAVAHAPVRHRGKLIGLLSVSSAEANGLELLTETLPALLEFAGAAGVLLGPGILGLNDTGEVLSRIAKIIEEAAFRPVFQPIVDVPSGAHVGYEALTRFADGSAPDLVFADARAAGLEAELEMATLAASIKAAVGLPPGAWLSLNVSPSLVIGEGHLAGLLRAADRPLVLEVTEHVGIADYGALRAAVGLLRPEVRVAVDDAGSGVANFSHIVELRPAFVKVDIGLVRGIDTDLGRQALMVGLLHFASSSASQTIAEGVETDVELATLRALGVPLAQGYLLGRPAPVDTWTEPAPIPSA